MSEKNIFSSDFRQRSKKIIKMANKDMMLKFLLQELAELDFTKPSNSKQKFYLNKRTADVHFVFKIGRRRFKVPAHKRILAAGSSVFRAKFFSGIPLKRNDIPIVNIPIETFKEFLWFFYSDNVSISSENVKSIMSLAHYYEVEACLIKCDDFLKSNLTDIWLGLEEAVKYRRESLKKVYERRISDEGEKFFSAEQFLHCSRDTLKMALSVHRFSSIPNQVLDGCVAWAQNLCTTKQLDASDWINVKAELGEFFYLIPVYLLDTQQISQYLRKYSELFDCDEFAEMYELQYTNQATKLKKFNFKRLVIPNRLLNGIWMGQTTEEYYYDNILRKETISFQPKMDIRVVAIRPFLSLKLETSVETEWSNFLNGNVKIVEANSEQSISTQTFSIRHVPPQDFSPTIIELNERVYCKANKKYNVVFTFEFGYESNIVQENGDRHDDEGTRFQAVSVKSTGNNRKSCVLSVLYYDFENNPN